MLKQSIRAQEIRINIPYVLKKTGEEYVIPEWLSKTPVTIVRCEDQGPATKYLPTLKYFEGTSQKVLVYDDDSIMPQNMVERYVTLTNKYPDKVLGSFGNRFDRVLDSQGRLVETSTNPDTQGHTFCGGRHFVLSLFNNAKLLTGDKVIEPVDMLYGLSGYCLRANMVDVSILGDYSLLPKEAFFVDDVVINGHLASRGVPRAVAQGLDFTRMTYESTLQYLKGHMFAGSNKEALSTSVNKTNHNNEVTIRHFLSHWGKTCPS